MNKTTKISILLLSFIMFTTMGSWGIVFTEIKITFPLLPTLSNTMGGKIDVFSQSRFLESYQSANSSFIHPNGLVLDSNLIEIGQTFPPTSFMNWFMQQNNLWFNLTLRQYNDLKTSKIFPYVILNDSNVDSHSNIYGFFSDETLKPMFLLGPWACYSPISELYIHVKPIEPLETLKVNIEFYDPSSLKQLAVIEDVKMDQCRIKSIAKDILYITNTKKNGLINIRTGEIYLEDAGFFKTDGKLFINSKVIFDLVQKKIIADRPNFDNFGSLMIKNNFLEFYLNPSPNTEVNIPTITRVSLYGKILEKLELKTCRKSSYYHIFDSYKNLALTWGPSCPEPGEVTYSIFDIQTGAELFEFLVPRGQNGYAEFYGNKAIFRWSEGARIIDLDSLKTIKTYNYSSSPRFVKGGKTICVIYPIEEDGKKYKIAYMLNEKLVPMLRSMTILPYGVDNFSIEGDTIYSYSFKLEPQIDQKVQSGYNVKTEIFVSKVGSSNPFKTFKFTWDCNFENGLVATEFKNGRLYFLRNFGELRVFDALIGYFVPGDWNNRFENKPENLSEEQSAVLTKDDKIIIHHPGNENWLLIYNTSDGKLVKNKTFVCESRFTQDQQRYGYVRNFPLHLEGSALVIESPPCVYFLDSDKIVDGGQRFLGISEGKAYFLKSSNFSKKIATIRWVDLASGESNQEEVSDRSIVHKVGSLDNGFFYDRYEGFSTIKGTLI